MSTIWARRKRFGISIAIAACVCGLAPPKTNIKYKRMKKKIDMNSHGELDALLTHTHTAKYVIKNCKRKIFHLRWTINLEWRSLIHRGDLIRFSCSLSLPLGWIRIGNCVGRSSFVHATAVAAATTQQPNKTFRIPSNRFIISSAFSSLRFASSSSYFFSFLLCSSSSLV